LRMKKYWFWCRKLWVWRKPMILKQLKIINYVVLVDSSCCNSLHIYTSIHGFFWLANTAYRLTTLVQSFIHLLAFANHNIAMLKAVLWEMF
jgi:hypothetical protein